MVEDVIGIRVTDRRSSLHNDVHYKQARSAVNMKIFQIHLPNTLLYPKAN